MYQCHMKLKEKQEALDMVREGRVIMAGIYTLDSKYQEYIKMLYLVVSELVS